MSKHYDKEFDCYYEDYYNPQEYPPLGDEFNDSTYYNVQQDNARKERKKFTPKVLPKLMMFFVAAAAAVGITVYDSFNIDILGEDVLINGLSGAEPIAAYVTYLPTGDNMNYIPHEKTYAEAKRDHDPEEAMKVWIESVGGDPSTLRYVNTVEFYAEYYEYEGETHIWLIGRKSEYKDSDFSSKEESGHIRVVRVECYEADQYYNNQQGEQADDKFPSLINLQPNGYAEGYGVLNEEYILFQKRDDPNTYYVVAGSTYNLTTKNNSGYSFLAVTDYGEDETEQDYTGPKDIRYDGDDIYYDRNWNQLTLNNFHASVLNINMMGNGFRIELRGDCQIDHLLIWGFHYGGSVTFVGNGVLTVNKDNLYDIGIYLKAECSESCIMVSPGVSLTSYGSYAAVFVEDTSAEKGLYYLKPLTLSGGTRKSIIYDGDGSIYKDYSVFDDEDKYAKYISIR